VEDRCPDASQVAGVDPNDRVEPAGQVTLGADLTKHLSIEAHSADLGSAGLSAPGGGNGGRINYHVNGVSALVYAGGNRNRFRRQGITAFGRLGYGSLENTPVGDVPFEQVNSNHFLIGAGLEYMTSFGVGVRLEGVSFDEDVQYGQLGLIYRTGLKQEIIRPKLAQASAPVKEEPEVAAAVAPPPPLPPPVVIPAPVAPVVNQCAGLNGVLDGSIGAESYNQSLSERRARSVAGYLSANGISRNRLTATAFGETSPIDTNRTKEGRALNRRVELYAR